MRSLNSLLVAGRLAAAVAALVLPVPSFAATEEACGGYTIVYGNGILNTTEDREAGVEALLDTFGSSLGGLPIDYDSAIDPTNGPWTDLVTVLQQKVDEFGSSGLTWSMAIQVFLGLSPSGAAPLWITAIQDAVQQASLTAVVTLLNDINDGDSIIAGTLANHLALYEELTLEQRQRVLIVAHSQGTIYANEAYSEMVANPNVNPKSLAVISVAALVEQVADGKGRYISSSNDLAVNALRLVFPGAVLSANITNDFHLVDALGHNFIDTYLKASYPSYSQLLSLGNQALLDLESNEWTVEQPLTVFSRYVAPYPWCSAEGSLSYVGAFPVGTANYLHAYFDAVVNGIWYVDPFTFDFKAQRYRDSSDAEISEFAFATMLNNSGQLAVIKDLDASGALIAVNGEPINSVMHQLLFDPFCGNEERASPVGTNPANVTSQYDSYWLEPQLTLLKTFPNVRATRLLSDWPQKTVAIKVCAAPEPEL